MITKTIGTILIVVVCIIVFPIGIAVVGGVFGIVAGVLGAVFGGIVAVVGGVLGAIFGVFEWIFDGIFGWHGLFDVFGCNAFTFGIIAIVIALAVRPKAKTK